MKTVLFFVALMVLGSAGAGQLTNKAQEQQAATGYDYNGSDKIAYYFHLVLAQRVQDSTIAANNARILSLTRLQQNRTR